MDLHSLALSILVLYIVVDPVGNIPLFMAVTSRIGEGARRRVLSLSVAVASLILAFFALVGVEFFAYFGVGLGDFMVASGLVLAAFSLLYLLRPYEAPVSGGVEVAVVPLAVPYLSGPASISYVLVLSNQYGKVFALVVVVAVAALTYLTLSASRYVMKALGVIGIRVVEKIMLVVSVAIGVSLVRKGVALWLSEGAV